jgi:hypothetical protein
MAEKKDLSSRDQRPSLIEGEKGRGGGADLFPLYNIVEGGHRRSYTTLSN